MEWGDSVCSNGHDCLEHATTALPVCINSVTQCYGTTGVSMVVRAAVSDWAVTSQAD